MSCGVIMEYIHRYNARDIVLPIFQNGHMCKIDATLEIISSFRE
jgi:hypothetical protein